jgi:uncharacterized membrane protein
MKPHQKDSKTRFWEIDFLRGTAIIMMILFHFLYDLNYFAGAGFNVSSGFWRYFAYATASLFIFLAGVSLTLSYSRTVKEKDGNPLFMKYLLRGIKIFSCGLAITVITFIFLPEGFIVFGILHFIGVSVILAYPFIKHTYRNLALGILFILLGLYLAKFNFNFPWLLWLGARPEYFYTFDYFPLLPWFGVILIGIFIGNVLYGDYERKFNIPEIQGFIFMRILCFLGKHSLLIYLIHQPALIALLYFFGVKINL